MTMAERRLHYTANIGEMNVGKKDWWAWWTLTQNANGVGKIITG